MLSFGISLFCSFLTGIALLIYSQFVERGENLFPQKEDYGDIKNISENLNKSVENAESTANELEDYSKHIFNELEGKYQELLFLYQLIDEKKRETKILYEKNNTKVPELAGAVNLHISNNIDDTEKITKEMHDKIETKLEHIKPKYMEIEKLLDEGNSLKEVAKILDMGQDEIRLIMTLSKRG